MTTKDMVLAHDNEPSDLKRTDWIGYDEADPASFRRKFGQAVGEIERLCNWEDDLLQTSLDARSPDCVVTLERANKGFLLSGDERFITAAERILEAEPGACLTSYRHPGFLI